MTDKKDNTNKKKWTPFGYKAKKRVYKLPYTVKKDENEEPKNPFLQFIHGASIIAALPIGLALILFFIMDGQPNEWWQFLRASIFYIFMLLYVRLMDVFLCELPFVNEKFMEYHGYAHMMRFFIGGVPTLIIGYIIHLILSSCCNIQIIDWTMIR